MYQMIVRVMSTLEPKSRRRQIAQAERLRSVPPFAPIMVLNVLAAVLDLENDQHNGQQMIADTIKWPDISTMTRKFRFNLDDRNGSVSVTKFDDVCAEARRAVKSELAKQYFKSFAEIMVRLCDETPAEFWPTWRENYSANLDQFKSDPAAKLDFFTDMIDAMLEAVPDCRRPFEQLLESYEFFMDMRYRMVNKSISVDLPSAVSKIYSVYDQWLGKGYSGRKTDPVIGARKILQRKAFDTLLSQLDTQMGLR